MHLESLEGEWIMHELLLLNKNLWSEFYF